MPTIPVPTSLSSWKALEAHKAALENRHLRELFAEDPTRGERFTLDRAGVYLDYSKNRLTSDTLALLTKLADESGLRRRIDAMFAGEKINATERRAVLHVALRAPRSAEIVVDGRDVIPDVHEVLDRMGDFSDALRAGERVGVTGKRFRHIVNIGIGGSDLGPAMAYLALRHSSDRDLAVHFVSNIDATDLAETLRRIDPETTLFIVCSKTFTTLETLTNAKSARQ
jgi:glucose-6-phosphate isomerase